MQRVFEIDVLVCEHCGGRRRVLTFLTDPPVLRRILEHLGLAADTSGPSLVRMASPGNRENPWSLSSSLKLKANSETPGWAAQEVSMTLACVEVPNRDTGPC